MLLPQIYLAYYELSAHILSHGVVVTPNACHVTACNIIHLRETKCSSLPNRKDSVLWEGP